MEATGPSVHRANPSLTGPLPAAVARDEARLPDRPRRQRRKMVGDRVNERVTSPPKLLQVAGAKLASERFAHTGSISSLSAIAATIHAATRTLLVGSPPEGRDRPNAFSHLPRPKHSLCSSTPSALDEDQEAGGAGPTPARSPFRPRPSGSCLGCSPARRSSQITARGGTPRAYWFV